MNETPKANAGRPSIARRFFRWLFLIVGAVATFTAGQFLYLRLAENSEPDEEIPYTVVNLIAIAFCLWLLSPFIRRIISWLTPLVALERRFFRWLFTWQGIRRTLTGLAILATLAAIFYTEEDWRGKRAWENCKRDLEAKGEDLNWSDYIPAPVPDDQNFFTASPKIALRFVKARNDAEAEKAKQVGIQYFGSETNPFPVFDNTKTKSKPLVVAEVKILLPGSTTPELKKDSLFLKLNDPAARSEGGDFIQNKIGRSFMGCAGFKFSEFQLSNLPPAQIFVGADSAPSIGDLKNLIPPDTATNIGHLQIEATIDRSIFQIELTGVHITAAADYLKWSDQFESDFDEIREALKRPYAIIPGDYSKPYESPIPNFIAVRGLAQTLAQRAQCDLMLGQPNKALQELTLLHDMRHLLEAAPTGKPMFLVSAMINVAVTGLYVDTIADGFQKHAWQEPQFAALQKQLADINLTPFVFDSLHEESAAICRTAQIAWIPNLFDRTIHATWTTRIAWFFWPSGWTYQNLVNVAVLEQKPLEGFDLSHDTIAPHKFDEVSRDLDKFFNHYTPYRILAAIAIPNFSKAEQVAAHNQTMVNEAQIVCALERYHLAHGEYPETLDMLMPQFMDKIPHDLIGGQPLHYRRTDGGKFLLYSVGWNETDDGGLDVSTQNKNGGTDFTKGDWIWKN